MTEQERINQLVDMLDDFTSAGGGHMNITVEDTLFSPEDNKTETRISADCQDGNTACSIPTLHQGIDNIED